MNGIGCPAEMFIRIVRMLGVGEGAQAVFRAISVKRPKDNSLRVNFIHLLGEFVWQKSITD
jgi:hypothetical protein